MFDGGTSPFPPNPDRAANARVLERTRWPQSREPLFGRELELAELRDRLRWPSTRIMTLTGPGGVGKTRLALEYALSSQQQYSGGAAFVDLSPVTAASDVVPAIANALGVRESRDASLLDHVIAVLRDQHFLLIIDNFEHVLEAAIELTVLIEQCTGVTVLATSRAPLRLALEEEFRIKPLAVSGSHDTEPTAAVQLFVSEARRLVPDFTLAEDLLPAIQDICQRLDGLPLAIKLAAGRSNILDPPALLERLEQRLPLLTTGTRDVSQRQRTMRNTIAWSYALLQPSEAHLFRCLSVFAGGFTLELAESMFQAMEGTRPTTVAPSEDEPGLVNGLATLINHHLVERIDTTQIPIRFGMLETIREFAREQLAEKGEAAAVRRAHASAITHWMEAARPRMFEWDAGPWLARGALEQPNVRAALEWAISHHESTLACRLAAANGPIWFKKGMLREAGGWVDRVLAMPEPGPAEASAICRFIVSSVCEFLGRNEDAMAHARAGLDTARAAGDPVGEGMAHMMVSRLLLPTDLDAAEQALESAIRCLQSVPGKPRIASCLRARADIAQARNDSTRFRELAAIAHDYAVEAGDIMEMAQTRCQLAEAALADANPSEAVVHVARAMELARKLDSPLTVCLATELGAAVAFACDDHRLGLRWLAAVEASLFQLGTYVSPAEKQKWARYRSNAKRAIGERAAGLEEETGRTLSAERIATEVAAYRPGKRGAAALTEAGVVRLTAREAEVLELIAAGLSDAEIAGTLYIARPTASRHVSNILLKLQVSTRTAAVDTAHRTGLLQLPPA